MYVRTRGLMDTSFDITPVGGLIGANVTGIDLAAPLSAAQVDVIKTALVQHMVLFFRDQHLTTAQHLALARRFGELEIHPFAAKQGVGSFVNNTGHPEVLTIESFPDKPAVAEFWHSDVSFRRTPSLGSILHMTHCPESGGDTLWANMAAAYDDLDDETKTRLATLTAVHDWHAFRSVMRAEGRSEAELAEFAVTFPLMRHPVIRTHPVTGRKLVYVNQVFTTHIEGLPASDGAALLHRLWTLADNPKYQVRFRWTPDAVVFWDNRGTQHSVMPDVKGHRRLERVTIVGDEPR